MRGTYVNITFLGKHLISLFLGFRSDLKHTLPDTAAMLQRDCVSLGAVRCVLDLFPILRNLPEVTTTDKQMEGQDTSKIDKK